jgi:hypothetical protein
MLDDDQLPLLLSTLVVLAATAQRVNKNPIGGVGARPAVGEQLTCELFVK